jgi:hypothetical protein
MKMNTKNIFRQVRIILLIVSGCLVISYAQAQISGPTSVAFGSTIEYSYNDGSTMNLPHWTANKGDVLTEWNDGPIYYCQVNWTASGIGSVTLKDNTVTISSRNISITACSISTPNADWPTWTRCGLGQFNLQATSGSGGNTVRWYNASSGGTMLTESTSYTTGNISSNVTFYLTSYNTSTGCESSPRSAISVTVNPLSASPALVTNASRCAAGAVTLSGVPGDNGESLLWYTSSSGGSYFYNGNSYTTGTLSSSTTYYVSSMNSYGCESTGARVPVTAYVNPIPNNPSFTGGAVCGSGIVTLTASTGANGNSVRWYTVSSGGSVQSSFNTYQAFISSPTTFHVSSFNSSTGCESARQPVVGSINPLPSAPSATNGFGCKANGVSIVDVDLSGVPGSGGNNLNWYNSADQYLGTNTSYTAMNLSSTATYYISTANTTTNCESVGKTAVKAFINSLPAAPISPQSGAVCGSGIVDLSASASVNGGEVYWYVFPPSGNHLMIGNTFSPSVSSTTNYSVKTYDPATRCMSSNFTTLKAEVKPKPIITASGNGQTICSGQTSIITLGTNVGETTWSFTAIPNNVSGATNGTGIVSSNFGQTLTSTAESPGTMTYTMWGIANGCQGPSINFTTNVNPPSFAPVVSGGARFGSGTLTLTATGAPGASTYNWMNGSDFLIGTGSTFTTEVISSSRVNYGYVKSVGVTNCVSNPAWFSLSIETLPMITATNARVVMGSNVTLDGGAGYTSYDWRNSSNAQVATTRMYTTNLSGPYTVTVTKAGVTGSGTSPIFQVLSQMDGVDMNYIISNNILNDNVATMEQVGILTIDGVSQSIQYFDGIGRPIQNVNTQGSPLRKDIVQPVVYDLLGREKIKYLPFSSQESSGWFNTNSLTEQADFFNMSGTTVSNDIRPFSEIVFQPSPLNRPLQQFGVGQNWKDNNKFIGYQYLTNQTNEVLHFGYDANTGLVSRANGSGGYYAVGQLTSNKTTDEQNNEVIEYTDKEGHTVCKKVQCDTLNGVKQYASTYYLYDDFGNLVVVLPPEAVTKFSQQ